MIEICIVCLYYCCNRKTQRRTTLDFVASSVLLLLCCRVFSSLFVEANEFTIAYLASTMSCSLSVRSTRVCTLDSAAASFLWSDILTIDPLVVAQFFSLRNSFVHDDLQLFSSVGDTSFFRFLCLLTLGLLRRQVVDFHVLLLRLGRRGGQVLVSVELWTLWRGVWLKKKREGRTKRREEKRRRREKII